MTGDTNPPSGVSIAHLEEVAITWRFSLAPASALVKRRKADQSFSKFGDEILCEITGGKNDTSFLDDILYSRYPHQEFCRFQASEPTATDALELEDDSILDTDYSSQESIASSIFSQGFYSNGSTSSSCMLLPEDSAAPQETVPGHKVVIKEWAKLVGLSFRSLISSDKRAVRGITSAQSSIEPKLAEISPPLFSPGYLPVSFTLQTMYICKMLMLFIPKAVAHRNAYIPTITRSIAAVYNRSKSSTLRIEIEQMTNLSLEERLQMLGDELGFETDSQPTSVMTPAITLRLWQICQRILFDPAAARYLSPLRLNTKQSPAHNCTSQEMLDEEDPCYSSNRASAITQHETSIKDLESQGLSDQATSLESLSEDALFEELESLDQHILLEECGFDDGLFCDSLIPLTEMSRDNDLHLPDVILDELEDDDFYDSLFTTGTLASDDDLRTSERIDELRADPLSALNNGVHDESCPIDEHMLEADLENTPSQYSCPIDEHMLEADLENTPSHYYNIEDDSMKDGKMDETYDPFDIKSESSDQMLEDYEMEDMDLHTRYLDENLMSD